MNNSFYSKKIDIKKELNKLTRRLPEIGKVEGLLFISDNFKHEGFEEKPGEYKDWYKRKGKKKKKKLIGEKRGGSLRRSWKQSTGTTANATVFSSALPYAGVHNDGGHAGRGSGFTMKKSEMIGLSEALNQRIKNKIDSQIDQIFK